MRRQPSPLRRRGALLLAVLASLAGACRTPQPERDASDGADSLPRPVPSSAEAAAAPSAQGGRVISGLEVLLRDSMQLVRGKRIGFITNQSAVSSTGESAIDVLNRAPGVRLVALFGPEHGLRGTSEGGAIVANGKDVKTGLPVYSLYSRVQRPTPEMLRDVDVLVFDIQDIGARPYTFVWTMVMAMEAAAAQHIPFVVLDRPNPITAAVDGPLMQQQLKDEHVGQAITGYLPVPLRHGMTSGEVAKYANGEYHVGADLHVVPAANWRGGEWFDRTGLRWINPSPNIRSLGAALNYSGLVLAEGTNLTVGRGTEAPFSYLGAPWMNAPAVLAATRKYDLPGVRLDTVRFVPASTDPNADVPYRGQSVRAIRLTVTDRDRFRPAWTTLVLLSEIKRLHPTELKVENEGFTQMIGSHWAREAFDRGEDPRVIKRRWAQELAAWMPIRDKYRMYPR
jgi:uncharacterized protein YbbC (DUF1343 family)